MKKTLEPLRKSLNQTKKGEIAVDDMSNERDSDSDEIEYVKLAAKDVKLASSVPEEGGGVIPTSPPLAVWIIMLTLSGPRTNSTIN